VATPDALGGGTLNTWFKADAITGIGDGAALTAWSDSSSGGHSVDTVAGTAPKYRAAGGPNSLPYVDHTVAAGGLMSSTIYSTMPSGDITYFMVVQTGSSAIQNLMNARDATYAGAAEIRLNNYKVEVLRSGFTLLKTSTAALALNAWTIVLVTFTSIGAVVYFDIGGTTEAYTLGGTQTFIPYGTTVGTYRGQSSHFNGKIAEIGLYSSVLSSGDLTSLKSYLTAKYFTTPPPPPLRRPAMISRVAVQRASRW
jgi:hypothetical protein